MLVARSQITSVVEAVETTFDGEHPCRLCSAIDSGRQEEQKREQDIPALKKAPDAKFVELRGVQLPACAVVGEAVWPRVCQTGLWRMDAPPTPPPLA